MARSRRWPTPVLAIALAAPLLARSASAIFIGVEDDRRIGASCFGAPGGSCHASGHATPAAPFAPFDATAGGPGATARQDSVVTPTYLAGTGSIAVFAPPADMAHASSIFDVTFDVTVTTPYELTGTVSAMYSGGISWIELFSGTTRIFAPTALGSFSHSGVFEPGQYRLVAELSIGGYGVAQNSSYQFLLIPEPHSVLLLGLGLSLLAYRRSTR